MMEGIRLRAERRPSSEAADVAHVVLWTIAFGLVVTSAVLVFRRGRIGPGGLQRSPGALSRSRS